MKFALAVKVLIYLQLNEAKHNERDDKWFDPQTDPNKMLECESLVYNVNMCEA